MRLLLPLLLLIITACSVPAVRQTLPVFNGKGIDYAMSYLGVPDRQYPIDGNVIYEWDNSYAHTYNRPVSSMGFGFGSHGGFGTGVGLGIPLGGYETETYRQQCKIKLITHKKIVIGHEMYGDDNGCALYAKRLKPLTEIVRP